MSDVLKKYVEGKSISAYQISKESGIPYTTIDSALKDGKKLEGQTVEVLKAVAIATDTTPGQLFGELTELDERV